jgi:hypothetical protein
MTDNEPFLFLSLTARRNGCNYAHQRVIAHRLKNANYEVSYNNYKAGNISETKLKSLQST